MSNTPTLVILAGGASSRMWPLHEKSLLRFGNEPLLLSQLRMYESLGFQRAVVVANPQSADTIQQLVSHLADHMQIHVATQPEPQGMGDALLRAAEMLPDDGAIYVNQVHDVVEDRLHVDMLKMYRSNPDMTYIAGVERRDYFPGGYLIVDETGLIGGIIEKPAPEKRPSNYVNIVAHIHASSHRLFEALRAEYAQDNPADDHYERAMDMLMKQHHFRMVAYPGRWDALKYPWHVLDIMETFLARLKGQEISSSAFVSPAATITGDVYIGEKAKIFPGAAIVGPAYIGSHTIVGNNALVRHSMVLDNCNVGFTTEVARSYVADGCQMHACRVLDSVFAPNVNFSAGCTTANLRIDKGRIKSSVKGNRLDTGRDKLGAIIGENAFLGVDVMTMPGVKIGENAEIGPGTHVHDDVRDNVRMYVKQEIVIIEK